MSTAQRRSLTSRPLDLLYFIFFAIHIPATLLLDLQSLFPREILPPQIAELSKLYLQFSADPIIAGAFNLNGPPALWVWLKSFFVLEAVFQLPVFFVGLRGLWKDSRTLYPLFLIYSASSSTTTIACLSTILRTAISLSPMAPRHLDPASSASNINFMKVVPTFTITPEQRSLLLLSYVPFLVVPLIMCIDMAIRSAGLIARGIRAESQQEGRSGAIKSKIN